MTATVKANSDGSADLLVNAIAAIHMAADGEVSFPQQGQSLTGNGYIKLPGGLIIQWGSAVNSNNLGAGYSSLVFPIPFPTATLAAGMFMETGGPSYETGTVCIESASRSNTGFNWVAYGSTNVVVPSPGTRQASWIAIGH